MKRIIRNMSGRAKIIIGIFAVVIGFSVILNVILSNTLGEPNYGEIIGFENGNPSYEKTVEAGTTWDNLGLPQSLRAIIKIQANAATPTSLPGPATQTSLGEPATPTSLSEPEIITREIPVVWAGEYNGDVPGTYVLTAQFDGYSCTCEKPVIVITVMPGAAQTGSISGFLWVDGNGKLPTDWNGLYNAGEQPLAGYTVYLYAADSATTSAGLATPTDLNQPADPGAPVAQVQTGDDGIYAFEGLAPGNYVVGLTSDTVNDTEYLLPMAVTADSKFTVDWSSEPLTAFSDAIEIGEGAAVENINAGMRLTIDVMPIGVMSTVLAQVIWNYPSNVDPNQAIVSTQISFDQMDWNKKNFHSFYDNDKNLNPSVSSKAYAYTTATSKTFNGVSTPDHVVMTRDTLRFLGYGQYNNLDLLYTDAYSSFETLDFTFKPTQIKFHTMNQSGFLFNGSFSGINYTGYALVVDVTPASGKIAATAALKLVYIDNQPLNAAGNNTFPAGGITFARQDIIKSGIVEGSTPSFHVQLAKSDTGFALYIDGNLVREVEPAANAGLPGFGFFTGYYSHSCKVLTVVEYSNLAITVKIANETATPMVKFVDKDTGAEIADAQTIPVNATVSYVGDEFMVDVTAVQTVSVTNGTTATTYAYVGSSVTDLNHITYQSGGVEKNTVILYYKTALMPKKHASVNGVADDGTAAAPADVSQGGTIDYRIDVNAPGPIRFVGTTPTTDSTGAEIRPLSNLIPSNKYYSYPTAATTNPVPAKPYDETSFPSLNLTTSTVGSGFNPVNLICHDPTNHLSCNGHQYAPYVTSSGLTGTTGSNTSYMPNQFAVFPNSGNSSPYITSWFINRINQNGLAKGTSRAFENYLWLQTPDLPAGDYKVSVKASVEFRMLDADDTRITPRHDEKHLKQTYTFTGAAMSADEYAVFMTAYSPTNPDPTTNPSPFLNVTGDFGYMGAGRDATAFQDSFMKYQDLAGTTSNAPFGISWNTNNLQSGGSSAHTSTTVNAYTNGGDRVNAFQMMANGAAFTYRGNTDAAADATYQTLSKTVTISGDGQGGTSNGVIGLNFTADMTLNTYSDSDDWSDRIMTVIRVYEVMYTPVGTHYTVADLLPEGLELADVQPQFNITSADPGYTGGNIVLSVSEDADTGRQLLTWDCPDIPAGATSIFFKAKVVTTPGIYENYADVTNLSSPIPMPDKTNSTWHKADVVKVTEQYRNILTGETLKDDTYTWLPEETGYGVAPELRNPIGNGSKTYRYCAYSADGGVTVVYGVPPDGQPIPDPNGDSGGNPLTNDYLWNQVYGSNSNIILYFISDVQITVNSVDHNSVNRGTVLKTWVDYSVPGGVPYIMSTSRLNPFDGYNYANVFDLNHGAAMAGVPANPVFSQTEMYGDNEITLDFAMKPMITMKFMKFSDDGQETYILKNPVTETVPYGSAYNPAQSANQPLPTQLADSFTGDAYKFVGYRLDGGSIIYASDVGALASIPLVDANHTYTLLYTSVYTTTLTVSKTVEGFFGDMTKQFSFTLTFEGADGKPLAGPFAYSGGALNLSNGVGTITLKHGQSITLQDIPADCFVQITETPDGNYTTSFADSENAVIPNPGNPNDTGLFAMTGNPRAISFTNARVVPPTTGISMGDNRIILLPVLGLLLTLTFYAGKRKLRRLC